MVLQNKTPRRGTWVARKYTGPESPQKGLTAATRKLMRTKYVYAFEESVNPQESINSVAVPDKTCSNEPSRSITPKLESLEVKSEVLNVKEQEVKVSVNCSDP